MITLRKGKQEWKKQLDEFLLGDKDEIPCNNFPPSLVKDEQTPVSQMDSPKSLKKSHTLRLNCKLKPHLKHQFIVAIQGSPQNDDEIDSESEDEQYLNTLCLR